MFPIKDFIARFDALLSELDALAEAEGGEALEDVNAELEDALLLLSELDIREEGFAEEWTDAMEELEALAEDYRRASPDPAVHDAAHRLEMAAEMGANVTECGMGSD